MCEATQAKPQHPSLRLYSKRFVDKAPHRSNSQAVPKRPTKKKEILQPTEAYGTVVLNEPSARDDEKTYYSKSVKSSRAVRIMPKLQIVD